MTKGQSDPVADGGMFAGMFDVLPSPYMVIDREFRFVAVNRAYEEAVMRQREELIGRKVFDAFPSSGASARRLSNAFDAVIETGETETLAFIPYEIERRSEHGGEMEQRFWTATHTPVKDKDGRVEFIIQNTLDVTEIVRLKETNSVPFRSIPSELALLKHAREVEEAYQETASESAEFRRLFRQAPGMIAVLEGPDQVFTFVNDSFQKFAGNRNLVGYAAAEAMPELSDQGYVDKLESVYRTGVPVNETGARIRLRTGSPEDGPNEVFLDYAFNPIRGVDGEITGVFVQSADRTEFVSAVERQRHLIDELNHRVKNTLSTVQSMARQSFRNLQNAEDARYSFEARIMALSEAHNVLSSRQWESAGFSVLLHQVLRPFDAARIEVRGEEIYVSAKSAIALAMVLHELASNAETFGAFSQDGGFLKVEWSTVFHENQKVLRFDWIETFPSAAGGKAEDGFGSRMMKRIIRGELAGNLQLDLSEHGFVCHFDVPLVELQNAEATAA